MATIYNDGSLNDIKATEKLTPLDLLGAAIKNSIRQSAAEKIKRLPGMSAMDKIATVMGLKPASEKINETLGGKKGSLDQNLTKYRNKEFADIENVVPMPLGNNYSKLAGRNSMSNGSITRDGAAVALGNTKALGYLKSIDYVLHEIFMLADDAAKRDIEAAQDASEARAEKNTDADGVASPIRYADEKKKFGNEKKPVPATIDFTRWGLIIGEVIASISSAATSIGTLIGSATTSIGAFLAPIGLVSTAMFALGGILGGAAFLGFFKSVGGGAFSSNKTYKDAAKINKDAGKEVISSVGGSNAMAPRIKAYDEKIKSGGTKEEAAMAAAAVDKAPTVVAASPVASPPPSPPSPPMPPQQKTSSPTPPKASSASSSGGENTPTKSAASNAPSSGGGGNTPTKEMIKRHEGTEYRPYKDSLGLWTVGVGHLIGDGKSLPPEMNRTFSQAEVDTMFDMDYTKYAAAARAIPGYNMLDTPAEGALEDLTFNMGTKWYKKWPNLTKQLVAGDTAGAANNLHNSKWYGQVGAERGNTIVSLIANDPGKGSGATSPIPSSDKQTPFGDSAPASTSAMAVAGNAPSSAGGHVMASNRNVIGTGSPSPTYSTPAATRSAPGVAAGTAGLASAGAAAPMTVVNIGGASAPSAPSVTMMMPIPIPIRPRTEDMMLLALQSANYM